MQTWCTPNEKSSNLKVPLAQIKAMPQANITTISNSTVQCQTNILLWTPQQTPPAKQHSEHQAPGTSHQAPWLRAGAKKNQVLVMKCLRLECWNAIELQRKFPGNLNVRWFQSRALKLTQTHTPIHTYAHTHTRTHPYTVDFHTHRSIHFLSRIH